jgi:peptidoglycan hydrolase FlgJ
MSTDNLTSPINPAANTNLTNGLENLKSHYARSASLKGESRTSELRKVTQEFEAVFVGYLLRVMRSTVDSSEEESESLGKGIYMEMFDQEIALHIARNRSLGIGEMMFRQLVGDGNLQGDPSHAPGNISSANSIPSDSTVGPGQKKDSIETVPSVSLFRSGSSDQVPSADENKRLAQPVEGVWSSHFGARRDPFTHRIRFHHGVDLAAVTGSEIKAAQAGTVAFSGVLSGYGNTVILEHRDGYRTLYAHAAQTLVSAGDEVQAEQVIGLVGNSGRSTGSHLHFELQRDGEAIDPTSLLKEARLSMSEDKGESGGYAIK